MTQNAWNSQRIAKVGLLLRSLYTAVRELEAEFIEDKRKFTLDGHLVGSIGEVVAAFVYELKLLPPSNKSHDAITVDGKHVQIKLTGGKTAVRLSSSPDYLIVLQLQDYVFYEVYTGPGAAVWNACGPMAKNGQRAISLSRLKLMQGEVLQTQRIQQRHSLPDLRN